MSKKRKAEAPAAAAAPKSSKKQQQTRGAGRKAAQRANRRARPRDDYYEAEDADAPDAHDSQRFDVSFWGFLLICAASLSSTPLPPLSRSH